MPLGASTHWRDARHSRIHVHVSCPHRFRGVVVDLFVWVFVCSALCFLDYTGTRSSHRGAPPADTYIFKSSVLFAQKHLFVITIWPFHSVKLRFHTAMSMDHGMHYVFDVSCCFCYPWHLLHKIFGPYSLRNEQNVHVMYGDMMHDSCMYEYYWISWYWEMSA